MATTYSTPPAQNYYYLRPWRDFLSLSALSLPISLSECTSRLTSNLNHFCLNYALISLLILILSFISHPLAVILSLLLLAAWFFHYLFRDEPVTVFDFQIDDWVVLIALNFASILFPTLTRVWWNVVVATLISAGLARLHAVIRFPVDADYEESPYGALLSSGVDDSPRGAC